MPNVPALPPQPIPPDLVKEMAMDIGKEVAAYIERQYPEAVAAASSTFLLAVRNTVYNEIMATLKTTDDNEIAERLVERRRSRRKLRSLAKAVRNVRRGDKEGCEAILAGHYPLEPDL